MPRILLDRLDDARTGPDHPKWPARRSAGRSHGEVRDDRAILGQRDLQASYRSPGMQPMGRDPSSASEPHVATDALVTGQAGLTDSCAGGQRHPSEDVPQIRLRPFRPARRQYPAGPKLKELIGGKRSTVRLPRRVRTCNKAPAVGSAEDGKWIR